MTELHGTGTTPEPQEAVSLPPTAEQVYRDFAPRVYHTARRMLQSDDDAEDVTQDVLLQVVRKLPEFRGEAALPTWLHRITVNAALSLRRRQAGRNEHAIHDSLDALIEEQRIPHEGTARPDAHLLGEETRRLIDEAIAGLPPQYREVFVLSDVEGLPNGEIAARLGMSLPAIKSRLHRARLLLREALASHFEESRA